MPNLDDYMDLDSKMNSREKWKVPRKTIKWIFWQTSINEQRPKLKVWIDNIYIHGLVNTGADVSITTPTIMASKMAFTGSEYPISGY